MDVLFAAPHLAGGVGTKTLLRILSFCDWPEICVLQLVSRGMREFVLLQFNERYTAVVRIFLPNDIQEFSELLVASRGAVTGACAYGIALPNVRLTLLFTPVFDY